MLFHLYKFIFEGDTDNKPFMKNCLERRQVCLKVMRASSVYLSVEIFLISLKNHTLILLWR